MELFTFEYLLLATFLVVFKAVPDGLIMRRNNTSDSKKRQQLRFAADSMYFIYHAVISIGLILYMTSYYYVDAWVLDYPANLYKVILGFLFFRFGAFAAIVNISSGEPINYIGFTKVFDRTIRWICSKTKFPVEHVIFIMFCFLCWGIGWLITANRP